MKLGQRLAKQLEDAYSNGLPTSGKLKRLNKKLDEIDFEIKQYENAIPLMELCFAPVNWLIRRKYKAAENETPIQRGRRVACMSEALYGGLFDSATTVLQFLEE